MVKLQVMICTFGPDGIKRVVESRHPETEGVEYIVGWQLPDGDVPVPEELLRRKDFKVFKTDSRGLSKNRNFLLSKSSAPYLLISDDDVDYSEDGLKTIIDTFESKPDSDIFTFKYTSDYSKKDYPTFSFDLKSPPKGYYFSSIEIAFRREKIQNKISFNEHFGVGAEFPSGEEDIFIHCCLKNGLKANYFPFFICHHSGNTTSERDGEKDSYFMTKGAVMRIIHPKTCLLRMISHALKYRQNHNLPSTLNYIRFWIKGNNSINKKFTH